MITETGRKINELRASNISRKVWLQDGRYGILVNYVNGDRMKK